MLKDSHRKLRFFREVQFQFNIYDLLSYVLLQEVSSVALNNKQLKAIELLVYQPYMTLNMTAQECGVSRDTLHRWRNETPEFMEALDKAIKERWRNAEAMAVNGMINLASEGNFQALKYMLDNAGYKPAEKIEAKVDAKAQVVFVDDLEDDVNGTDSSQ